MRQGGTNHSGDSRERRIGFRGSRRRGERRENQGETFFVGRRPFEAAEVYFVAPTRVERLRSEEKFGSTELDWFAPSSAALELAHALLSRLVGETPSERVTTLFAVDLLSQLDDDGFVLSSAQIFGWIVHFSQRQDWSAPYQPNRRPWIARAAARIFLRPSDAADLPTRRRSV